MNNRPNIVIAAEYHNTLSIIELLDMDPHLVDEKDHVGDTALMVATAKNYHTVVNLLLYLGANPELKDQRGYNALSIAAHMGHLFCVQHLLDRGADIHKQDAIQIARNRGKHQIVDLINKYIDREQKVTTQRHEQLQLFFSHKKNRLPAPLITIIGEYAALTNQSEPALIIPPPKDLQDYEEARKKSRSACVLL